MVPLGSICDGGMSKGTGISSRKGPSASATVSQACARAGSVPAINPSSANMIERISPAPAARARLGRHQPQCCDLAVIWRLLAGLGFRAQFEQRLLRRVRIGEAARLGVAAERSLCLRPDDPVDRPGGETGRAELALQLLDLVL